MKVSVIYGSLNRLEQAVNARGETALYTYNGLGHGVGKTTGTVEPPGTLPTTSTLQTTGTPQSPGQNQNPSQGMTVPDPLSILENQDIHPEKRIQYTIDLTRGYHNLLQKEEDGNTQSYLWDVNVTGLREDGRENYYLQDELGSPIRLTNQNGELQDSYGYDEFGQDLYRNQGITQPFGYTGYQPDRIAGTYYAQAREYRPELGRFVAVDPIKKGLNWYAYCRNNSLKYFDPLGLEKIVVSGGVYSEDKLEDDAYYYEFVDAAIAQINEWNSLDSNESIMWIIADNGWTELNKKELMKAAKSLGVDIQFITDKSELIEYINNKEGDINERAEDKISDISVFSHGLNIDGGVISLGFNYDERNMDLDIGAEDINELCPESFAQDLNSNFYSCNIGTMEEESFAQKWVNEFGGTTTAFKGRTDYAKVPDNSWEAKIMRRLTKMIFKVSMFGGNTSFPVAGTNAEQLIFKRNDFENKCIE